MLHSKGEEYRGTQSHENQKYSPQAPKLQIFGVVQGIYALSSWLRSYQQYQYLLGLSHLHRRRAVLKL